MQEVPTDERPPLCVKCEDVMRPDVVLFGENLPEGAYANAEWYAKNCDVCLVVGTSALVYPAAALPEVARAAGAFVVEINPEETAFSARCHVSLRGLAGEILPQLLPSDGRELVLSIACEGGGEDIYRKKTEGGAWKYRVEGDDMEVDEEERVRTWEYEAGDTLEQAIEALGLGERLLMFGPEKVHPEYRQAIWAIIERITENLSDDFKARTSPEIREHHLRRWRMMTIDADAGE